LIKQKKCYNKKKINVINLSSNESTENTHYDEEDEEEEEEKIGKLKEVKKEDIENLKKEENKKEEIDEKKEIEEKKEEDTDDFDTDDFISNEIKEMKIKLIISENNSGIQKNIKHIISPVLTTLRISPKFGMFHSSIMIGPWLLEWNDSGLCVPRTCVSRAAFFTADLMTISSSKRINEVRDKIANVITKWNGTMSYTMASTIKKK